MVEFETWSLLQMLLQLLVKLTVLLGIAVVVRSLCFGASASLRHSVLATSLLALPLLLIWECCGPRWQLTGPPWLSRDIEVSQMTDETLENRGWRSDSISLGQSGFNRREPDNGIPEIASLDLVDQISDSASVPPAAIPLTSVDSDSLQRQTDRGEISLENFDDVDKTPNVHVVQQTRLTPDDTRQSTVVKPSSASIVSADEASLGGSAPSTESMIPALLCGVWFFGSLVMAGRLAYGWWLIRRTINGAVPASDTQLKQLRQLVPALQNTSVNVVITAHRQQMPMCGGLFKQTMVLPRDFHTWEADQKRSVVSHELAHLMRNDPWINLFSRMQTVVLWFHPLQHWFMRCLQIDREIACDDWVIGQGMTPSSYARALLNVSTGYRSDPMTLVFHAISSKETSLEYRVKHVLNEKKKRLPIGVFWRLSIACIGLLLMSAVAAMFFTSSVAELSAAGGEQAAVVEPRTEGVTETKGEILPAIAPVGDAVSRSKHPQLLAVNLGNWLMLEPWLLDLDGARFKDQHSILSTLNSRFGEDQAEVLMDVYRRNWITLADLEATKKLGFNAVRLPFDFGLLESADQPQTLRPDAFEWLDHAVDLCQQSGLMVILDLHGAPGGQSLDGPSGNSAENDLWTDELAQARTIWLWQQIAKRYADSQTVAAYDIVNEPYGDFSQDLRKTMLDLFDRIYQAIRKVDPETLIYAPATLDGFAFYGNPEDRGWVNVGFTHHAYPGLFDGRPAAVRSHEMFIKHWVEPVDRKINDLNVPFLLGEYNVVFDDAGGAPLTAWYASEYGRRGWSTAIWTLKRALRQPDTDKNSWALLTNDQPYQVDLANDSYDVLTEKFESLSRLNWHAENKFLDAFSNRNQQWEWPEQNQWLAKEIGTDVSGSSILRGENWIVTGAGRDIFGTEDRFHFQCQAIEGNFVANGRVLWIDETSPWAKSGWMIREDDSIDAAHLFIHATPDGKVVVAGRDRKSDESWQKTVSAGTLPVVLQMARKGSNVILKWTDASGRQGSWTHTPDFLTADRTPLFGLAVCSLSPGITTSAGWDSYSFRRSGAILQSNAHDDTSFVVAVAGPQDGSGGNRETDSDGENAQSDSGRWVDVAIANPSFETADQSDDMAKNWNRWGQWINRETQWEPVNDGRSIIGYHHFRIQGDSSSGLWQDISVQPGQRLRFQIAANADLGSNAAAESVELRIEDVSADGESNELAQKKYDVSQLSTGSDWSTLEVIGEATGDRVRLVIEITPSKDDQGSRDGSVKLDSATLAFESGDNKAMNPKKTTNDESLLVNASFEDVGTDGQLAGWSGWGQFLNRQDQWTPVKDGKAILAYEHYQTSGGDSSGVWQDIDVKPGEKLKFSVFANVDFGKGGTKPPSMVEIKIESPSDGGSMVTLAKKTIEAKDLSSGDRWSLLSIEAVALKNNARLLIIAHPSNEEGTRDGALKFDSATAEVVHQ